MSLRSPLGRVRGLGSAKEGVAHWWAQRLTAVALVPLVLWFVVAVVSHAGSDYKAAMAWLEQPFVAIALLLLIVATFHHAQLGLQVVIEDYVHAEWARIALIMLVKFAAAALAIASIYAVLKIAFGA
jgi:succinate dehydrogenase / fumarate reductase, membrane anchor subunit